MKNPIRHDIINYINKRMGEIDMSTNISNNKGQKGQQINNNGKSGVTKSNGHSSYVTEKAVSNPVPNKGGKKNK